MPLAFYILHLLWLFVHVASARVIVDCCRQLLLLSCTRFFFKCGMLIFIAHCLCNQTFSLAWIAKCMMLSLTMTVTYAGWLAELILSVIISIVFLTQVGSKSCFGVHLFLVAVAGGTWPQQ